MVAVPINIPISFAGRGDEGSTKHDVAVVISDSTDYKCTGECLLVSGRAINHRNIRHWETVFSDLVHCSINWDRTRHPGERAVKTLLIFNLDVYSFFHRIVLHFSVLICGQ